MNRDRTDVALALVAGVLREGGATVSTRANDVPPRSSGYYVGGLRTPLELKRTELQPWDIVAWLERTDVPASAYVGSWESDGVVYFDVSEHVTDRTEAEMRGLERGELAIWDLAAGEEVRLLP